MLPNAASLTHSGYHCRGNSCRGNKATSSGESSYLKVRHGVARRGDRKGSLVNTLSFGAEIIAIEECNHCNSKDIAAATIVASYGAPLALWAPAHSYLRPPLSWLKFKLSTIGRYPALPSALFLNVTHCIPERLDTFGDVLRNANVKFFLEIHHYLHGVQRIGSQF